LKSTERQFVQVLQAASPDTDIQFRFFTFPEIPRSAQPQTLLGHPYAPIDELFDGQIDGLIVTGMEPRMTNLRDEPIWPSLTRLLDWAEAGAVPAIWSCLAAHAAVLHLSGISRVPIGNKLSGVFECDTVSTGHRLTAGLPPRRVCPHSRYYDLPEASLVAGGYRVLSRSATAGVDVFVKNKGAPFVFFQGHPEYHPDTLQREYIRDVRRYISGERTDYPMAPSGYFSLETEAHLARIRAKTLKTGAEPGLIDVISEVIAGAALSDAWQGPAEQIYANWLGSVIQSKPSFADDQPAHPVGQSLRDANATAVLFGR
jgi:homoserine O-succinyltransferase